MAANPRTNTMRSEHYGQLQRVIDAVFADGRKFVRRLDVVVVAESCDCAVGVGHGFGFGGIQYGDCVFGVLPVDCLMGRDQNHVGDVFGSGVWYAVGLAVFTRADYFDHDFGRFGDYHGRDGAQQR